MLRPGPLRLSGASPGRTGADLRPPGAGAASPGWRSGGVPESLGGLRRWLTLSLAYMAPWLLRSHSRSLSPSLFRVFSMLIRPVTQRL